VSAVSVDTCSEGEEQFRKVVTELRYRRRVTRVKFNVQNDTVEVYAKSPFIANLR